MITRVLDAADRQAFHTAGKQEASQQLQAALVEGERMATVLQMAVKQHYGIRSEKLADFGMKPFRGRNRKGTSEEKPKPPAVEPEPEPTGAPLSLRPASHLAGGARSARPPFSCLLSPSPSEPEKSPSVLSRSAYGLSR